MLKNIIKVRTVWWLTIPWGAEPQQSDLILFPFQILKNLYAHKNVTKKIGLRTEQAGHHLLPTPAAPVLTHRTRKQGFGVPHCFPQSTSLKVTTRPIV